VVADRWPPPRAPGRPTGPPQRYRLFRVGTGEAVGAVVVGVVGVVVVVGSVVGVVVVGVVVGTVVVVVVVGDVVQAADTSGPVDWSAGTVATAAPLWSAPTTVAPVRSALPGAASTAMPAFGATVSTVVPPDVSWTDATPPPTQTATQPTGAPSWVPKEPAPRTSTVSGEGGAVVGRGTEPVPTARSVDSSTTN